MLPRPGRWRQPALAKGQVCKSTDGNGNVTSFTYGALGMPTTITMPSPLGAITNVYDDARPG
ncbi:hypothetical protein AB0O52_04295 [Arthrobacter sp. NPDC080073]|uniref:hypothetical protein n=1 Tax=Arthrobacter sp. NPDC080073 TaxID=3155919 RepID=UPI003425DBC6